LDFLRYEEIYSDDKIWLTLDNLCTILILYILCIIEEENLAEDNNSLSVDHYLFDQLNQEEPYNIEWVSKTLNIYKEDSSQLD
jgi:hypothetical protein